MTFRLSSDSLQYSSVILDPCDNFRCKRGKTCKLDAYNKPSCVCQDPTECHPSANELDHVSISSLCDSYTGVLLKPAVSDCPFADCWSIFCRFVGRTTKHTIHRVNSLLLNATWKAPREQTDFIWTTLGHANVIVHCCTILTYLYDAEKTHVTFIYSLCISLSNSSMWGR